MSHEFANVHLSIITFIFGFSSCWTPLATKWCHQIHLYHNQLNWIPPSQSCTRSTLDRHCLILFLFISITQLLPRLLWKSRHCLQDKVKSLTWFKRVWILLIFIDHANEQFLSTSLHYHLWIKTPRIDSFIGQNFRCKAFLPLRLLFLESSSFVNIFLLATNRLLMFATT
mgnify:CR=1 FL=1